MFSERAYQWFMNALLIPISRAGRWRIVRAARLEQERELLVLLDGRTAEDRNRIDDWYQQARRDVWSGRMKKDYGR